MVFTASPLKVARLQRGWSRARLAALAWIHPKTLARIEEGQSNPHAGTIHALAGALGIDARGLQSEMRAWHVLNGNNPNLRSSAKKGTEGEIVQLRLPIFYHDNQQ